MSHLLHEHRKKIVPRTLYVTTGLANLSNHEQRGKVASDILWGEGVRFLMAVPIPGTETEELIFPVLFEYMVNASDKGLPVIWRNRVEATTVED